MYLKSSILPTGSLPFAGLGGRDGAVFVSQTFDVCLYLKTEGKCRNSVAVPPVQFLFVCGARPQQRRVLGV